MNLKYTDLHVHILPGLDDGASDWQEACEIARTAWKAGACRLVATPHYIPGAFEPDPATIKDGVRKLQDMLMRERIPIDVIPGAEVHLNPDIDLDFAEKRILPLGDSGFVLVELPFDILPGYFTDALFRLRLKGCGAVLAHPERNREMRRNIGFLREVVDSGVYVQVNAGSLVGAYGREVQTFACKMVKENLFHFIGSDAHSGRTCSVLHRGADIRGALKKIVRLSREGAAIFSKMEDLAEKLLKGSLL